MYILNDDGMIASMNAHEMAEQSASYTVRRLARTLAAGYSNPCDVDAATVALLMAALEIEIGAPRGNNEKGETDMKRFTQEEFDAIAKATVGAA